ncbi:hypothetical protein [Niabella drilacis]|nr:hypothetical protein [Niabella drilacis]
MKSVANIGLSNATGRTAFRVMDSTPGVEVNQIPDRKARRCYRAQQTAAGSLFRFVTGVRLSLLPVLLTP